VRKGASLEVSTASAASAAAGAIVAALARAGNGLALSRFSVIYATPLCVITPRSPGQGARGVQEHLCLTRPYVSKARTLARAGTRISHQRIGQGALGRSVAKAAVAVSGPPTAARAVAIALAAPPGPVIANMDDGAAGQPGPQRAENGVEAQTLRAYENMAAWA